MNHILVLGGARSGKSAWAEQEARASGKHVVYIATGSAGDAEMAARIALHRQQRPAQWLTVEEPLALGAAIQQWSTPGRLVLVDCLTLWLSNLMFSAGGEFNETGPLELPECVARERAALLSALALAGDQVILVSNELGMGIVPYGALSRAFADEAGRLNQAVAQACPTVAMIIAGLPLMLKSPNH